VRDLVGPDLFGGLITGSRRSEARLTGDQLSVVLDLLALDALPGVLNWSMPYDTEDERRRAFDRAFRELSELGLVTQGRRPDHSVDPDLTRWILLLARPVWDLEVRIVTQGGHGPAVQRVCLSAGGIGGSEHVLAAHDSDHDTYSIGSADPGPIDRVISLFGPLERCPFASVSAPTQFLVDVLDAASSRRSIAGALVSVGVPDDDAAALSTALSQCTRHVEVVANVHRGAVSERAGNPVALFDTPAGRIVVLTTASTDGSRWTSLSPGSPIRVRDEIAALVRTAEFRTVRGLRPS
jgi:hypothetical protein